MNTAPVVPQLPASTSCVVTTSWDDGHVLDHKLADLLDRHGITGTFYIAQRNHEIAPRDRLGAAGIRELGHRFEIGAHTLTHQRLSELPDAQAAQEMRMGKQDLEQITGSAVTAFCYPCGDYRPVHVRQARKLGFSMARTVRRGFLAPGEPLEMRTTVNAYAHRVDVLAALRMSRLSPRTASRLYLEWDELAIAWFERCLTQGGVYHLWGHSWEVEARGDWQRLERVLEYIAGRPGVRYLTNGQMTGVRAAGGRAA